MNEHKAKFNLGKVMALQRVRRKIIELNAAMTELGEPVLDDLELLPMIYQVYLDFFRNRGQEAQATKVYNRQKLILIVLYLYSPRSLAGGKMRIGLRDKISELFGITAKTTVSDNSNTAVCHYKHYRDFRKDVDALFTAIVDALGDHIVCKD